MFHNEFETIYFYIIQIEDREMEKNYRYTTFGVQERFKPTHKAEDLFTIITDAYVPDNIDYNLSNVFRRFKNKNMLKNYEETEKYY